MSVTDSWYDTAAHTDLIAQTVAETSNNEAAACSAEGEAERAFARGTLSRSNPFTQFPRQVAQLQL